MIEGQVIDTVMPKARREWAGAVVVYILFVLTLVMVGFLYAKTQIPNSNVQFTNNKTQIVTEIPKESPKQVAEINPVFAVWNGSGVVGAAGKMAETLKASGYEVSEVANAPEILSGLALEIKDEYMDQKDKLMQVTGATKYTELKQSNLKYDVRLMIGK